MLRWRWREGMKASAPRTDCSVVITAAPKVAWMSDFKKKSTNKDCTLTSFVMFTAVWTDSTGRNQQLCDLISAFTVYSNVQCLWKKANSLEYCALSPVLLLWNVTVQFDLCILKIHSFLLLYIYMCPCMFVQNKKRNVYFLYLSLHVLISPSLFLWPHLFYKTTVFNFVIECVCACVY